MKSYFLFYANKINIIAARKILLIAENDLLKMIFTRSRIM